MSIKTGEQIGHHQLQEHHVPRPGAQWGKIIPFASTFNAYEQLRDYRPPAFDDDKQAQDFAAYTLTDLRAALFFEYRRYNHFGYEPDTQAMIRLHALVEEIRLRIQNGRHKESIDD